MNSYGKIIYALLSGSSAVTTKVGNDTGDKGPKIYPVTMPEIEHAPAVVFTKSITPRDVKGDPFKNATCEVSVYAIHKDLDKCEELVTAIEGALRVQGNQVIAETTVLSLNWLGRDDEKFEHQLNAYNIRSRFFLMTYNN